MLHGPLSGIACSISWGVGDFAGGIAAKRMHVFVVVFFSQLLGLILVGALALAMREALPPTSDLLWGGAAGLSGAIGVTCLYAALASGRMGVAAPITGVIAAVLPVSYAWIAVGAPSTLGLAGMALAIVGIALASGERAQRPAPRVLGLAILSGLGFAGFLVLMGVSSGVAFLWTLTSARVASSLALLVLVLAVRAKWGITAPAGAPRSSLAALASAWPVVVAGLGDTLGNAFFLLAARLGRLDVAVVLSALYPITTVLLARYVLKERLTRAQAWGAALMMAAIPLVASA